MLYSLPTGLNTTPHSHSWHWQTCRNNGLKITRAAPACHITPCPGGASQARRACAWLPVLPGELSTWEVGSKPFWGATLRCDSLLTPNPPRGPADGVVYPGRTCCLSGAGLLLQCQFRGCSHLSWAVLLNRFSQHQVRVWEHGSSCCRQPARLQAGSANPTPQQKGLWAADCPTLRLPPLRCSSILPELPADWFCFNCPEPVLITASPLHVWAADQSLRHPLGACQTSGISGPTQPAQIPASDEQRALESERGAEAENPHEKCNCFCQDENLLH